MNNFLDKNIKIIRNYSNYKGLTKIATREEILKA